jgi:tRNA(Ile2) C34 agmatinyltransferase TiaS
MPFCYLCPADYPVRSVPTAKLTAHVAAQHPEVIDEAMPTCPNCGMRCEAGRNPQPGWLCRWCGVQTDQRTCPTCDSQVHVTRLRGVEALT